MVATMLFAVIGTASAAVPNKAADFSACPTNTGIPDGGFTDVAAGSFFDDAVNCLAYYGVTQGTAAGTYGPADDVTRAQMALFLARGAAAAGVTLKASPPSAGFTDIGGLSAEAQLAINQLADAGIVKGKTATTYLPSDTVLRQHMALFLTRFLDKAIRGPGGNTLADAADSGSPFTDISQTTVEASKAINEAWDLGIAWGTTATTFNPLDNVNRGQMALFLTRLMAHTNTRPAGVNIQSDKTSDFGAISPVLSVTHRDASFGWMPNILVDVFEFTAATGLAPFNADGTCKDVAATNAGGVTLCGVALGDPSTGVNGNLAVITEEVGNGDTVTYYAWTAATGTTYDNDVHGASNVTVTSSTDANESTFKSDIDANATEVKYGDTITFTVQLTDGTDPIAKPGVDVIFMDIKTVAGTTGDGGTTFTTVATDATGKATYMVTQSDPSATGNNDGSNAVSVTAPNTHTAITVNWDDDAGTADKTLLEATSDYVLASDAGNGAANSVTATVYDEYGDTVAGETVAFSSTGTGTGIGTGPINVITNSSGVASLGWNRADASSAAEVVTADGPGTTNPTVTVYWVIVPTGTDYAAGNTILFMDKTNDKVVFLSATGNDDADEWLVVPYDSGDQFNLLGSATTLALFEAALFASDIVTVTYSAAGVSVWNISTNTA